MAVGTTATTGSGAAITLREIAVDGTVTDNVVTVRLLALCPMLAVSVSVETAAVLSLLTTAVMVFAGVVVSLLRPVVSAAVRLPVFLLVVAGAVGVADVLMAAFAFEQHRALGIFLPLIITNCAVLARLELFAFKQSPLRAAADGFFCGGGMLAALCALAVVRELLGSGTVFGVAFFDGGAAVALLPAGGFVLFGLMLAAWRVVQRMRRGESASIITE